VPSAQPCSEHQSSAVAPTAQRYGSLVTTFWVIVAFGEAFLHRHLVCLSSQIDRHRRTALHFEPGRGGASPPLRAAARPVVRSRPIPHPSAPMRRQRRYRYCLTRVVMAASGWGGKACRPGGPAHGRTRACPFCLWRFEAFYALEESTMAASNWGMCKDCEWWQSAPGANIMDHTMGVCTEEELQPFRLRVSGRAIASADSGAKGVS
jgi:hypothetical protein